MDREISENTQNILRSLLGIQEHEALPENVIAGFWALQRLSNRCNSMTTDSELKMLCFSLGYGKPIPVELNPSLVSLWRDGKIKHGAAVMAMWRKKKLPGKMVGISGACCLVLLDDDDSAEERKIPADLVQLAVKGKKPELAAV